MKESKNSSTNHPKYKIPKKNSHMDCYQKYNKHSPYVGTSVEDHHRSISTKPKKKPRLLTEYE